MMNPQDNGGMIMLMNSILHKSMEVQNYPIAAKVKDEIKLICEKTFDMMVQDTDPMTIARLIYNAEEKAKIKWLSTL
ncbi:MAG: hypothetical protein ACW99F_03375 [Candidatus Hodarchaeales archaeon]|jgi:hypothetical protein